MLNGLLKNPAVKYQKRALSLGLDLSVQNWNNLKRNVNLKLDLTKKRYSIFTDAMQLLKSNEVVKFVMADINCRLKVALKDGLFFK